MLSVSGLTGINVFDTFYQLYVWRNKIRKITERQWTRRDPGNVIYEGKQMALKVFLSSTLRPYIPGYDPSEGVEFQVNRKTTVSELCKLMNIPMATIKIVMVNGKSEPFDYELQGDERIGFFPPVGGG